MTAPATAPTTSTGASATITNLDAQPQVRASAGAGAPSRVIRQYGTASLAINTATTNLTRLVRIPSNAIIQCVKVILDANPSTSLAGSLGLWYSDSVNETDGTSLINAGNLTAISSAFFMPATVISTWAAVAAATVTKSSIDSNFGTASAGASVYVRSVDPGGFFDICYQETTTGVNTSAVKLTCFVDYVSAQ